MLIAETYYCTDRGKVKGILTLTEHLILFDPIKCLENESYVIFASLSYLYLEILVTIILSDYRSLRYSISLKDKNS